MKNYLIETPCIDYMNPLIQDKVRKLKNQSEDNLDYIKRSYIFVRDEIPHSWDIKTDLVSKTASEELENSNGYRLVRSNEKIDHVIGELYDVDERIKESYYKLKCIELLLFFSITNFVSNDSFSLSVKQVDIVESVKKDLISDLSSKITLDELAARYGISKTTLKNCFKEVYGKPIFKWRKEYKLD